MNARNLAFFILASAALMGLAVVWLDEAGPPPDAQADVWAAMFPMRTLPPDAVPDNAAFGMTRAEASAAARLLQAIPPEVLRGQGMDQRFATPEMIQAGSIRDPQARHQAFPRQDTLTFQVPVLASPTLAASPAAANLSAFPRRP